MTSSREPRYRHGWSDGHAIGKIDGRKELIDELLRYDPTQHRRDDQYCCKACEGMMAIVEIIAAQRMQRRDDQDEAPAE